MNRVCRKNENGYICLPCKRKRNLRGCECCGKTTIVNKNKKTKKLMCCSCAIYTSPPSLYKKFYNGATKRKIEFDITLSEFSKIIEKSCFYCGTEHHIGVDRKNNNVGYKKYNCVPCCATCNFMKGKLEINDFIYQIKNIYKNLEEK